MSMRASPSSSMAMPMATSAMTMPMSMQDMSMTFVFSTSTPLFSTAWTPRMPAAYAVTCIFLVFLSTLLRLLYCIKSQLEARWRRQNLRRRCIITTQKKPTGSREDDDSNGDDERAIESVPAGFVPDRDAKTGVLTVNGVDEHVRLVQGARGVGTEADGVSQVQPFRLSVDLVRAAFVTVMVGVAYLLMLAVMTMNVGYFLAVLAGAFLGELLFGRWSTHADLEHH